MAAVKALELTEEQVAALEKGYRNGPSHAYRTRCRMILLKGEGRSAANVAQLIGCCSVVVHGWVSRYRSQGLAGLKTRARTWTQTDIRRARGPGVGARGGAGEPSALKFGQGRTGRGVGPRVLPAHPHPFCKKNCGRYKRIRKRPAKEPDPQLYALKVEALATLERLSEDNHIDLYYADESRVSTHGYVPYGWQFDDEEVWMPAHRGPGINCFALLSRACECRFETTVENINSDFFVDTMERFSGETQLKLQKEGKLTVIVVDNASVHSAQQVQERRPVWEERGLFLFYLPPYSPQLNLAEVLWRQLKGQWLQPRDYLDSQRLFYAVRLALAAVGSLLHIQFSPFGLTAT